MSGFGFSEEDTSPFVLARENLYGELFGDRNTVNHELQARVPHVDVYVFEPGYDGRDFFTLITGGMSDRPMRAPADVACRRAEIVLYADRVDPQAVELLRWLAHLVHDQSTWLSPGSTMTNGQPPQPIFEGSKLNCFVFLDSVVQPDAFLHDKLAIGGDPVDLLWVVPISEKEMHLIRNKGLDPFLDLLDANRHSHVLNALRRSYV
ncbi:MAG: suppressor of fused domain protein [Planctomycetota bacterium]